MSHTGDVYALANRHDNSLAKDTFYFVRRSSAGQWLILDSAIVQPGLVEIKWGYTKLWTAPWGTLYSTGAGVFEWNGEDWNSILSNNVAKTDIKGTSASDLFVCGHFGLLYHFNGLNWYQFQQFADADLVLTALLVFESDVFILGHQAGGYRSFVFHGK